MVDCNAFPFDARWTDTDSRDEALKESVLVARHEFAELDDAQIRTLWQQMESILLEWAKYKGIALPTHKPNYSRHKRNSTYWQDYDPFAQPIDFIVLFYLTDRYPPLDSFLATLDANPFGALRKAYALLMLREAAEDNWSEVRRLVCAYSRVLH